MGNAVKWQIMMLGLHFVLSQFYIYCISALMNLRRTVSSPFHSDTCTFAVHSLKKTCHQIHSSTSIVVLYCCICVLFDLHQSTSETLHRQFCSGVNNSNIIVKNRMCDWKKKNKKKSSTTISLFFIIISSNNNFL